MDKLLDFAPCGFVSFSDDGTILAVNTTLKKLTGHDNDLVGQKLDSILTISSRIFYNTHFFPLIRLHLKAEEIFITLLSKDKSHIPVLCNAVRISEKNEYENHCVFIPVHQRKKFEDELVAARKAAEDALKKNEELNSVKEKLETRTLELDKQIGKLVALNSNTTQFNKILSHDFNEPLRKIKLFSGFLMEDANTTFSREGLSAMGKISRATERLKALTDALYEFVKIDFERQFKQVDLKEVAEQANKNVSLLRKFDDYDLILNELPSVEGYPVQLQLLFHHLLDNSIQFRDPSRRLIITISSVIIQENIYTSTSEKYKYVDYAKITFSDNGKGFQDEYNEYVFDLLKKMDVQSTGVGLGLSLSKKIIGNHSGSIRLSSVPGKGTDLKLLLPLKFI